MRAKGMYRLIAGLLCMMIVLSENSIYTLASTAPVADAIGVFVEPETQEETTESQNSEIVETSSAEIETVSSGVEETEGLEETTTIEETSTVQQELETMEEEESSQEAITSVEEVIEPETFGEEDYEEAMKVYGEFMDIMATSGEEYNLTEEQLFLQCPQYLKTNAVDTYLSRCVGYTVDAMNDVSGTEEVIASLLYALENGTAFLTKEIAALCGITDSTYSDFKKEMAMELVKEYVGTEAYLKDLAEDVSKNFSIVDNFYGKEAALVKAEYITQLKKASVKMSDSDIEKTVNKLFEKSDTLMKYAGAGITVFDMITAIIEVQELEITLVDELMICLEDSYDTDLYEGLVMIRNDITDDVVTYIIQNYVVDDAIKYISGMVTGIANANISTGLAIAKIAVTVISGFYEGFKPSVSNIINTTVMYNYYNTLEASVYSYQKDFYKKQATTDDIKYFRAAYKGHLCAIKLMMKYAKGLTGNQRLKNQLEIYGESIGKEVTCDTYIKLCLRDASAAIDAGTLVLEESGSVDKTEDGTVMDETYDSTESITARLNVIMQKYVPGVGQTWKDNWGGAIQCFGFVRMVFNKLYGCDMPASYYGGKRYEYTNEKNVTLIGKLEGSEVTTSNIKNMFAQGHIGDVIQGHGAPYGQHTMMLLGVTDTGIRTYECNLNGECGIYTRTYTWEKLALRYGTGDSNSGNGLSLYHANNYEKIYGNGDNLFYDDSVNFVIQDGVLTKYNGWQNFVTIPEEVTSIGDSAFAYNENIIAIDIPDTVTTIGDYAFYGCSNLIGIIIPDSVENIGRAFCDSCSRLTTVSLSDNVKFRTIPRASFERCYSLTKINIPDNITKIEAYAFNQCKELKNIKLSNNLEIIEEACFLNCISLEKITIPKSLEETEWYREGLDGPTRGIFYGCINLNEVVLEEGITHIPSNLFHSMDNLEKIEIPNTVKTIKSGAFADCVNLREVVFPDNLEIIEGEAFFGCIGLTSIIIPDKVKHLGRGAFWGCRNLETVQLPNSLEMMEDLVFYECTNLAKINIPKSLKEIEIQDLSYSGIFNKCTNLKEIVFDEGIEEIPANLFYNAIGLEKIVIPDTVLSINDEAFRNCTNIKEISFSKKLEKIGYNAFGGCINVLELNFPMGLKIIEGGAFEGCNRIEQVQIPDSVIEIGGRTFSNCTELKKIKLSNNLKTLDSYAFQNCQKLTEIKIPKSLESAGFGGVFYGCTQLKNVQFEEGITRIVAGLFSEMESLEEMILPDTVLEIGYSAFENCTNLKTIYLPDRLRVIGSSAFSNCSSLIEIWIPDSVTEMEHHIFSGCTLLEKVHLPETQTVLVQHMFRNCSNLKEVNISEDLREIGYGAFYNCDSITEVNIPNKVENIGQWAYYDCDKLEKVSIPNSVTQMGNSIFYECDSLKEVLLGNGINRIESFSFANCKELGSIVIPYSVEAIENNVFYESASLCEITLPRKLHSIGSNNFLYPENLTIYGITGTYAETYAEQIGATFVNKEVKATEVKFLSDNYTMNKGAKTRMIIAVTPENFTDEIIWRTADTDIISVDDDGVVTAKALGTAKVQVIVGDVSATRTITVRRPVSSISLNKTALSLDALQTSQLKATVYPSDASVKTVKWSSSNEAVATVDQTGKVTALTKGQATITVAAQDGSGVSNTCTVNVLNTCYVCKSPLDMESAHNYESNCTDSWIYTEEGAKQLFVSFDDRTEIEDDFDFLYIYDKNGKQVGKYTGTSLAGEMVKITGDTVRIKLVTDKAGTKWGFKVTRISQTDELDPIITTTTRPYANIASGSHVLTGTEIILSCKDEGAQIYYTIDGSEPLLTSSIYNNPIIIQQDTVIKAIADKEGLDESPTVVYEYYIADSEDTADTVPAGDIPEDGIPDGLWIAGLKDYVYTGKAIKPEVRVYDGSQRLTEGRDYTIKYKNNTKANDASVAKKAPTIIVKGKGNYTGTVSETFKILPVDLESKEIMAEELLTAYTGKVQKKVPILKYNGKKLVNKKDFMVSYPAPEGNENGAFKDVGTYEIVVTAKEKGNYTGSTKVKLTITERILMSKVSVKKIPNQLFEGKDVEPELTITRKGAPDLIKGVDYTVVYENNDGIGTATAVITGIGSYIGVKRVSFKIIGVSIKNAKLSPIENKVFDGTEQKQNLELYWNNAKLEEGEHYKVTYSNNINSGTAKMVIEGINLYTGTIKKTFKISPYNLKEDKLKKVSGLEDDINVIYTKGGCKPTVKLFYGDTELVNGIDYKMSYKNSGKAALATAAKAPTMVIKGKGNYSGTLEKTFTIESKDFSNPDNPVSITVADLVVSKSAGKYKSIPSLYDSNGKKLKAGTDYESKVVYRSEDGTELTNKHKAAVGEKILVEVTGKGSYFNTITATYEITKKDFRKAKITIKPQEYTGQSIYLNATDIKVSVGKSKLTFGKDYEIVENSYKNNLGKGRASVTIRGIGNYGGAKTVSFKIGARSITDFWKGIYAKMAELWN